MLRWQLESGDRGRVFNKRSNGAGLDHPDCLVDNAFNSRTFFAA